jgi:hypothetical protein
MHSKLLLLSTRRFSSSGGSDETQSPQNPTRMFYRRPGLVAACASSFSAPVCSSFVDPFHLRLLPLHSSSPVCFPGVDTEPVLPSSSSSQPCFLDYSFSSSPRLRRSFGQHPSIRTKPLVLYVQLDHPFNETASLPPSTPRARRARVPAVPVPRWLINASKSHRRINRSRSSSLICPF